MTNREKPERLAGQRVMVLIALSIFGPYVSGPFRLDQIVAYGFAVAGLVFCLHRLLRNGIPKGIRVTLGAWILYVLISFIVAISPYMGAVGFPPGSVLAGMDNLLLPLAGVLAILLWVPPKSAAQGLRKVAAIFAFGMAVNAIIGLASTVINLDSVLRPFWAASGVDGATVSELAATMGRFSGIFNQPAEAGLAYAVACLCAIFLLREHSYAMYPLLALLVVGGIITVSKVFLVSLPIILVMLLSDRAVWGRTVVIVSSLTAILVVWNPLANWSGLPYFLRFFDGDQNLLTLATAGRFGSGSTLSPVITEVWSVAPLYGLGPAGLATPYDNGWVEALVVAGMAGVVLYSISLLGLFNRDLGVSGKEYRLMRGVATIAVLGSLGIPVLTANRSGLMIWILVALAVQSRLGEDQRLASSNSVSTFMSGVVARQAR